MGLRSMWRFTIPDSTRYTGRCHRYIHVIIYSYFLCLVKWWVPCMHAVFGDRNIHVFISKTDIIGYGLKYCVLGLVFSQLCGEYYVIIVYKYISHNFPPWWQLCRSLESLSCHVVYKHVLISDDQNIDIEKLLRLEYTRWMPIDIVLKLMFYW